MENESLKICKEGHKFFKSSRCNICPECEKKHNSKDGFLSNFSAPARRALESKSITSIEILAKYNQQEILSLHGMGMKSILLMQKMLLAQGLEFRKND